MLRYALLLAPLFLLPQNAHAQGPDSVRVAVAGNQYPAYGALFGPQFVLGQNIGPLPLVRVEGNGATAAAERGCDPLVNGGDVAGNIAYVLRGGCGFVVKVQNAAAAGAVAVVVYNDDRVPDGDETITPMGGECTPAQGCDIPAAFVSRASGLAILAAATSSAEATIIPIRVATPPPIPTVGTHDTGVVEFDVFDYGFLGAGTEFAGTGFAFNGEQPLFVSSVLVGINGNVVSNPYDGASEWTKVTDVASIATPFPAPFEGFDQGFVTRFENTDAGVRVTERSYSKAGDPYVIVELAVENISASPIAAAYVGIFADWETGSTTSTDDSGAVNDGLNLVYVFDAFEGGAYVGVAALGAGSLSGYSVDATEADDAQLFEALTTAVTPSVGPASRAAVSGVGPFSIAVGASAVTRFAYVGGVDEADLFANAQAAQAVVVAVEAVTPDGAFVLGAAYPNPVTSRATIGFELPTAQDVRLTVYDVLGREVAVLTDGMRAAGTQSVTFDAVGLPSGTYLYRLEVPDPARGVEEAVLTRRLTIIH